MLQVRISHKDETREELISVYQTVQQFKVLLNQWFDIAPQNMRLYYYDEVGYTSKAEFREIIEFPTIRLSYSSSFFGRISFLSTLFYFSKSEYVEVSIPRSRRSKFKSFLTVDRVGECRLISNQVVSRKS